MWEALLAGGLLAVLGAVWAAWVLAPVDALLVAGAKLVAAGLAFGLPTGAWYHVALRRSLARAGVLPPRWWLHPTRLHDRIPAADRTRVLGWCYAGAAGFLVTLLGCAIVALAAARTVQGEG